MSDLPPGLLTTSLLCWIVDCVWGDNKDVKFVRGMKFMNASTDYAMYFVIVNECDEPKDKL